MKKPVFSGSCLLLLIFSLSITAHSQAIEGDYMNIDYLMVDRNDISHFESHIESVLKEVQQARVDAGTLKEWFLYQVIYPSTQNPVYNYVSVSRCSNICAFENIPDQIADQYSTSDFDQLMKNFNTLMLPVKSELWRINNQVLRAEHTNPAKYFSMDYMNVTPGMNYAYQMMEDELAKPLHEQRMVNNTMEGWELFRLIIPGGTQYGYNFATGNHYNNLRDFEFGFTDELIRQNHPDTDVNEFFENIEKTRDPVRIEMWKLVDYVIE
ncbi:MAG: hypothetical protein WDZ38_01240 [Balneolaceae bacterium]